MTQPLSCMTRRDFVFSLPPSLLSAVTPSRDRPTPPPPSPPLTMELRSSLAAVLLFTAVCLQPVCGAASRRGPKVTEKVGDDAAFTSKNTRAHTHNASNSRLTCARADAAPMDATCTRNCNARLKAKGRFRWWDGRREPNRNSCVPIFREHIPRSTRTRSLSRTRVHPAETELGAQCDARGCLHADVHAHKRAFTSY